uniref:Putative ovule protein n=1 Tax=Solanum chacoense TaxID=4108 RepID=A0A0V0GQJ0_SOLCH
MWIMQQKLKNLGKKLSVWSKDAIGDIFQKVEEWEETVQRLEDIDSIDNTKESRVDLNKGQAEYISWMGMQEALLK